LADYLAPIHKRRKELEKHPKKLESILLEGEKKARKIAAETLKEARQAMGIL
jgi:tryptophanyl-tRNA synthetase